MGLFDKLRKPKWKDENPQIRIEGVNELAKDVKHVKKNQEILKDILENDPDSDVRISAIQKVNSDASIKEAALNDSDWKVRKAAVENLKLYLDSTINLLPDTHYEVNRTIITCLENISKNDSNSEVREAASKLANDPKYNKNALKELHKNDPKNINYTVVDVSRNTEKNIVLTQNEKFEYIYEANSVKELMDCCFGGDIITITYLNMRDGNDKDLTVDYNILDKHVFNPNKIAIEGTNFDRVVTYENADTQRFTGKMYGLSREEIAENSILREVLRYYLHNKDKFFLVKKGEEIKMNFTEINDFLLSQNVKVPNLFLPRIEYRIKKIEFICRKIDQIPKSENMSIYRE